MCVLLHLPLSDLSTCLQPWISGGDEVPQHLWYYVHGECVVRERQTKQSHGGAAAHSDTAADKNKQMGQGGRDTGRETKMTNVKMLGIKLRPAPAGGVGTSINPDQAGSALISCVKFACRQPAL